MTWEELIQKIFIIHGFRLVNIDKDSGYVSEIENNDKWDGYCFQINELSFMRCGDVAYTIVESFECSIYEAFGENRTPDQMYQIIKALTDKGV